jgi:hypothetical protein
LEKKSPEILKKQKSGTWELATLKVFSENEVTGEWLGEFHAELLILALMTVSPKRLRESSFKPTYTAPLCFFSPLPFLHFFFFFW